MARPDPAGRAPPGGFVRRARIAERPVRNPKRRSRTRPRQGAPRSPRTPCRAIPVPERRSYLTGPYALCTSRSRSRLPRLGTKSPNLGREAGVPGDARQLLVHRAHPRLERIPLDGTPFPAAAWYSGGTPSTMSTAAVPRTSKTCGGNAFVPTVRATFGFVFSAEAVGACGTGHSTNGAPVRWKRIGIARGKPSGPRYASRAGMPDCVSSCATGSLSTRATSCGCTMTSLWSRLHGRATLFGPEHVDRLTRSSRPHSLDPRGEDQAHAPAPCRGLRRGATVGARPILMQDSSHFQSVRVASSH